MKRTPAARCCHRNGVIEVRLARCFHRNGVIFPFGGRELLAWPYAVRAVYYRVFLKQVGVDADFVNVADPQDLEYTLKNLTPGASIQAYVVPMNAAGAGAASPTVTKVVGA